MPVRKRIQLTQQDVDAQLQSIHLLDASSVTENLEALGPIIKAITESRQQEAFLRTVNGLVESKDEEIQKICRDNYLDFVSSVSTLLTVRSYTMNLRERITLLDQSVTTVGRNLALKKKELLQRKRTAANLDQAIDTLQGCLRILDLVKRIRDMIKDGRYWSALRSLEEIQSLPPSALSQTPLYTHLVSSLPSLRAQIKDAVTASNRTWLLEVRNVSGQIGKLALEEMKSRTRRWRNRRDKEPMLRPRRVGSAVELVVNEKTEYHLLDNDQVHVDFQPLHQCIHIYTALSILPELQASYQADRKTQASLIISTIPSSLPSPTQTQISISTSSNMSALQQILPPLTHELLGFFVIELEVLRTTVGFRSMLQVEEVWQDVVRGLIELVENGLRSEKDGGTFAAIKDTLTAFLQVIETFEFDIAPLQTLMATLFEKHSTLLEQQFRLLFDQAVAKDDYQPMLVTTAPEREQIFTTCWMAPDTAAALAKQGLPLVLPFSGVFFASCSHIRQFVEKYYQFIEGASHHYRNTDESLRTALDGLLTHHLSEKIAARLPSTTTLFQAAQIITNVEHFLVACAELEEQLTKLRSSRRGGHIRLQSAKSFEATLKKTTDRIAELIKSKLNDFFELSEYDWTPPQADTRPRMYMEELYHWLMTVVDSLPLEDKYKDQAFKAAFDHVSSCLMDFLFGPNIPMLNQNGIASLLVDVDFLENEFKAMGKTQLTSSFNELRLTTSIPMNNAVSSYLQPSIRRSSYQTVNPKNLYALLDKMAKYGRESRLPAERELAERRRRDADTIARQFLSS
ncbi:hypothetical protein BS47DRAFT_1323341 [Hydnum rufescens UP504]|uniref:Exocyst complex component SEC15 n=1 Tax=Hydnum rufescens UP504 TaxID=1448309 RepID=A0A9P6BAW2_9AGAM|nr:hypothetical protein BS47DRAFT_1323341 [Hydnum rufescens UP504]